MRTAVLFACDRIGPVVPESMVSGVDLIVRARAVDYSQLPRGFGRTSGRPESIVHFRIEQVVKGRHVPTNLDLAGDLLNLRPIAHVPRMSPRGTNFTRSRGERGASFLRSSASPREPVSLFNLAQLVPTSS
jgi:hypothetical protein